jgi:hypothetical protein
MGAENGIPCMANDGGAKAYVHSLGEALHYEFKPLGVYVTVLAAGVTNTAVLEKFALDPKTMPMKPMSVKQCVSEGLSGLVKNRSRIVPGRLNRILNALVPASLARKMLADMLGTALANKPARVCLICVAPFIVFLCRALDSKIRALKKEKAWSASLELYISSLRTCLDDRASEIVVLTTAGLTAAIKAAQFDEQRAALRIRLLDLADRLQRVVEASWTLRRFQTVVELAASVKRLATGV